MALVQLHHIKKEMKEKELFDIDYATIYSGDRIGLVGANGSGKTTLLNVIAKEEEADSGYVEQQSSVTLLPQLKRTDTTKSGGETTAEYVVRALNENPAVLLADEPTTHLDASRIEWLEKKFQSYQGAYIVVSHDRTFLDKVCDTIWELREGKLTIYSGNYSQYESEKEKELQHQQTEYNKYKKKERQLEEARKKRAEKASTIEGESKHFYFRKKAKKLNKVAKAIESRMDQLEEVEKPKEVEAVKMELPDIEKLRNRFIIRGFDFEGEVPNKQLWEPADIALKGGEKIALIGDNGSGKTTLLKKIIEQDEDLILSPALKIGYFAQNLSVLEKQKTIIENVSKDSKQSETVIRTVLAQLHFKGEQVYKPVSVLSGGEKVKVSLAKLLVGEYNLLILDEPTNFLDIQAVEALENLLKEYPGSLLVVSHDRRFISEIASKLIVIENQVLSQFEGTYDEWTKANEQVTMNDTDEELMRIENEISNVLGRLSLEPSDDLEKEFQKLLKKKNSLKKE